MRVIEAFAGGDGEIPAVAVSAANMLLPSHWPNSSSWVCQYRIVPDPLTGCALPPHDPKIIAIARRLFIRNKEG